MPVCVCVDLTYFKTMSAILDSASSYVLQAEQRCRRCGIAGGERVPPSTLGWYSIYFFDLFLLLSAKKLGKVMETFSDELTIKEVSSKFQEATLDNT